MKTGQRCGAAKGNLPGGLQKVIEEYQNVTVPGKRGARRAMDLGDSQDGTGNGWVGGFTP